MPDFLANDPLGFYGRDANLYRYVGNDPTDATDPSGLMAIMFDGAGYRPTDNTIMSQLVMPYLQDPKQKNGDNGNPIRLSTSIGNLEKKVDGAMEEILKVRKDNPTEPIDIFGWSRGGIAAITLVHQRLANHKAQDGKPDPIPVRFLGLLDPTAPLSEIDEDPEFSVANFKHVDGNVQFAAILYRDGKHDDWGPVGHAVQKKLFVTSDVTFSKETNVLVNKSMPLGHFGMGFDRTVFKELWEAAEKAGVYLGTDYFGGGKPWEAKDYDDKPRGNVTHQHIIQSGGKDA